MPAYMPPYATVLEAYIQPMLNVPLAYVSVYRRASDIFHTLAYASTIRNCVTGPLVIRFRNYLSFFTEIENETCAFTL